MLLALLVWAYTLFLCWVYGALFFRRIPFALTIFAEFSSLFFQVSWQIHLGLLAGALYLLITRHVPLPKIQRPVSWLPFLVLILSLFLILENATQRPTNPDTNLYHAQAIRWIETYPAVPGLGNLHGRLAFNSAWLVTNALFSFSFLGLRSFHLSAGFLSLVACFIFWQGLAALAAGRFSASNLLKTGFLFLTFYVLGGELSSPGTDLPVSLLIWLVAVLWLEKTEDEQPYHLPLIGLLAFFAVTIKLSALPLLLILLPYLRSNKRRLLWLAACGLLVMLPFVLRNVILSGYLVYPYPSLDLFSVDWKIPPEIAEKDRQRIIEFGRFVGAGDIHAPFSEWFLYWLSRQSLNRRVLFFAALLTPLAGIPLRFRPRPVWGGWLVMVGGLLFWLASAPDFRFGYGFLPTALLLALLPWLSAAMERFPPLRKPLPIIVPLLLAAYLLLTLVRSFETRTFAERVWLPADYDRVPVVACSLANAPAYCARHYGYCSYAELPCAPSPRSWVELRGADLWTGFRSLPR